MISWQFDIVPKEESNPHGFHHHPLREGLGAQCLHSVRMQTSKYCGFQELTGVKIT